MILVVQLKPWDFSSGSSSHFFSEISFRLKEVLSSRIEEPQKKKQWLVHLGRSMGAISCLQLPLARVIQSYLQQTPQT